MEKLASLQLHRQLMLSAAPQILLRSKIALHARSCPIFSFMGRAKLHVSLFHFFSLEPSVTCQQGNILQAFELARRYHSEGIVSIPLNPGNIKTDLARHMPSFQRSVMVSRCSSCACFLNPDIWIRTLCFMMLNMGH